MKPYKLFSIGYAGYNIDNFIETLKINSIDVVVDVRSIPYSKRFEDYNEPYLKTILKSNGIYYIFFGDSLGARPNDYSLYTDNRVDFDKFSKSQVFIQACNRLRIGLEKYNICLLCSEKDPATCHRTILIARNFKKIYKEIDIAHILSDGSLEYQDSIDKRLLTKYKLDSYSLLTTPEEQVSEAYKKQAREISYSKIYSNEENE